MKTAEQTIRAVYRVAALSLVVLIAIATPLGSNTGGFLSSPVFDDLEQWVADGGTTGDLLESIALALLVAAPILSLLLVGLRLLACSRRSLDGWLALGMVIALVTFVQAMGL